MAEKGRPEDHRQRALHAYRPVGDRAGAKLLAAKPDAVFIAATGGPAVLPQATLLEKGYRGKLPDARRRHQRFHPPRRRQVEGTLMAGGPMLVADDLPAANPIKAVAQGYIKAYEAKYGAGTTSTFGANTFDAGLLLGKAIPEALKKAKPGTPEFRAALRDALEATKRWSAHRASST